MNRWISVAGDGGETEMSHHQLSCWRVWDSRFPFEQGCASCLHHQSL